MTDDGVGGLRRMAELLVSRQVIRDPHLSESASTGAALASDIPCYLACSLMLNNIQRPTLGGEMLGRRAISSKTTIPILTGVKITLTQEGYTVYVSNKLDKPCFVFPESKPRYPP